MKKLLATLLAVMMIFGAFGVVASAETYVDNGYNYTVPEDKVLVVMNFVDCSSKAAITNRFNMDTLTYETSTVEGGGYAYFLVTEGQTYTLPSVKAPDGYDFTGWYCNTNYQSYGANSPIATTEEDGGRIIQYMVQTEPSEPETDTLDTIMGVLVKVFGAILGLFLGDMTQGQEIVSNLIGSLFA